MGKHGSVSSSWRTQKPSRTLDRSPTPRFGIASSPVLRFDQRGRDRMVSSSWRTQKPTRARARPNPHPAGHPCSPLPGSFFLYIRMGKHGSVSSSWRTQKTSRVRDKPKALSLIPVSCPFRGLSPCSWRPGSSGSIHPAADKIHHTYTPDREPDPSSALWLFLVVAFFCI